MKAKKKIRKKCSNSQEGPVRHQHKDRLFRFIFRDKKYLLDLYNALRGSNYQNENELAITTLEGSIYLGMKNDLSFIIDSVMNLYEHQSTWNPNMPLRGLFYFAKLYQAYVKEHGMNLYGNRRIRLPLPQYIVFYNGTMEQPDSWKLQLSDVFLQPSGSAAEPPAPCLECIAVMLNINKGHNRELMEKCRRLWEYAEFVAQIRDNQEKGLEVHMAVDAAIDYCLENNILTDILIHSRVEVMDMLLEEYNEKETREYLRREAWEDGRIQGKAEAVLELLQELGTVVEELQTLIMEERDLQKLKTWHKLAAKAKSIEEFCNETEVNI